LGIRSHTHRVTGLLLAWGKGDEAALNQLIPLVHDELRRAHFLAMSARLMRRILVDVARSKGSRKRGGGVVRVTFDDALAETPGPGRDLVALDDALEALAAVDARKARVIELRYFGGLSVEETAAVLTVSADTVMRDWKLAKAWLQRELRDQEARSGSDSKGATP
jgi:RNA polymerase sigma-70 factor, ECF subfamily